jgi:hypothetical protein
VTRFRDLPVLLTYLANVAAACITVFWAHADPTVAAAVVTVGTGAATVVAALLARPVSTGVVAGAFGTVAAGVAGFGVHLPPSWLALAVISISGLVAFFHHSQVTPITRPPVPA